MKKLDAFLFHMLEFLHKDQFKYKIIMSLLVLTSHADFHSWFQIKVASASLSVAFLYSFSFGSKD